MSLLNIGDLVILKNKNPLYLIKKYELKRFECDEGTSYKFWEVFIHDDEMTVRWGRIGTEGQTQSKSFKNHDEALKATEKLIKEKLEKGYRDFTTDSSFIYIFKNMDKESWISSYDFEPFMKKHEGIIQKRK